MFEIDKEEFNELRNCVAANNKSKITVSNEWSIDYDKNKDTILIVDSTLNETVFEATESGYTGFIYPVIVLHILKDRYVNKDGIIRKTRLIRKLVIENIKFFPDAKEDVLLFIANFLYHGVPGISIEDSCESVRSTFRAGYCYYFAAMLREAFKRGEVCQAYPFGHIVWVDTNNVPYDVEGVYSGEATKFISISKMGNSLSDFMHIPKTISVKKETSIPKVTNSKKGTTLSALEEMVSNIRKGDAIDFDKLPIIPITEVRPFSDVIWTPTKDWQDSKNPYPYGGVYKIIKFFDLDGKYVGESQSSIVRIEERNNKFALLYHGIKKDAYKIVAEDYPEERFLYPVFTLKDYELPIIRL